MAEQLRDLQRQHPTRFSVVHSLTRPPADWTGLQGRGSVQMARLALPPPRRANVQQPPQAGMQQSPQAGMQQPPQAGMQAPPHGNSRHLQEPSLQNSRTGGTGIERRQATSSPNSSNASTLEASTTDRLYTNSADPEQREMHPSSLGKTMIFVCGRDGFVSTWAGPRTRSFHQDGTSLKAQGPLSGILEQSGYSAEEVYKY
uniref:Uncharacterized protein n=2 Tax=Chrysotila carterae TaxID=13221 RepID=A0A7S4B667_CHRCT